MRRRKIRYAKRIAVFDSIDGLDGCVDDQEKFGHFEKKAKHDRHDAQNYDSRNVLRRLARPNVEAIVDHVVERHIFKYRKDEDRDADKRKYQNIGENAQLEVKCLAAVVIDESRFFFECAPKD